MLLGVECWPDSRTLCGIASAMTDASTSPEHQEDKVSTSSGAHPPESGLAAYGLGQLPAADAALVEEHLLHCDRCARRLDELPLDPCLPALRDAIQSGRTVLPVTT